jgi:SAM-dependent methyltransferase
MSDDHTSADGQAHTDKSGMWTGVAAEYNTHRPRPPKALLDLLTQLARLERPRLVVDLGSGTGLSTLAWAERAEEVVGIEPNDDMRGVAEANARARGAANVRFVSGVSTATGLPEASTDLVTVSQALHWMDPTPTFVEAARILRPGGIFAAYDYDWPPMVHWELDQAYHAFQDRLFQLARERGVVDALPPAMAPLKEGHLRRMRESGVFRFTRSVPLHSIEEGDAERFVGLTLSNAGMILFARDLLMPEEVGVDDLRATVRAAHGAGRQPWYIGYHVRFGVK